MLTEQVRKELKDKNLDKPAITDICYYIEELEMICEEKGVMIENIDFLR